MLLLAQADAVDGNATHELVQQIRRMYDDYTLHDMSAPLGDDTDRYFNKLARLCCLGADVNSAFDFEDAIEKRLTDGEKIFLVLRGFENGPAEARRQMAQILRNLYDNFQSRFRVVISGASQLAQLYFVNGAVSPLRFAHFESWPEYDISDVAAFYRQLYRESLDAEQAKMIHEVSGGHLGLIRECLKLRHQRGATLKPADYSSAIRASFALDRIVAPVMSKPELASRFRRLIEPHNLGPAIYHLADPALRKLYWWNLLTRSSQFRWRCEAIRCAVARLVRETV